ncbi:hypothetical protein [Pedobacter frigiditerrae]|uniref:hypothetical protein n=1 Tax=Pedobacter frigiditerrae TaxID=2530452 RepID=UPI00292F9B3C|nr:hypothetical protein [Pedobacter frigiditerrae]
MKLKELVILLKNATAMGTTKALAECGQLADQISKAEAYRLYGRGSVDRWISEGLIKPSATIGKNPSKCLDREKVEAVAASSNRKTYLPVAER